MTLATVGKDRMGDFRLLFNYGGSNGQVHRFEVRTNVPKLRVRNTVENPVSHHCAVWTRVLPRVFRRAILR